MTALPVPDLFRSFLSAFSLARVDSSPAVRTLISVERRDESSVFAAAFKMELWSTDICAGVMEFTPVCSRAMDRISPGPPPLPPPAPSLPGQFSAIVEQPVRKCEDFPALLRHLEGFRRACWLLCDEVLHRAPLAIYPHVPQPGVVSSN